MRKTVRATGGCNKSIIFYHMSSSSILTERAKEVLTEGRWVTGTNFKTEIETVAFPDALKKVGDLYSIAELTFHITYYLKGVNDVFDGQPLSIKDKFSFDAPPLHEPTDWQLRINTFCHEAERFIGQVQNLNDKALVQPFANANYGTNERNINALIEHTYYHLGQVVLIKKLIRNS